MKLKLFAYAAIISAISPVLIGLLLTLVRLINLNLTGFFIQYLIEAALAITILLGYIKLAKINKFKFLEIASYISVIWIIIYYTIKIIFQTNESIDGLTILFAQPYLYFINILINSLLGISLFKLKTKFGSIIIAIAVIHIIAPITTLAFLNFIPNIQTYTLLKLALNVLEAILFFKAAKYFTRRICYIR